MKVLLVSYLLNPRLGGGAATAALRLGQGLAQQGIEVVAVTTHDEPEPFWTREEGMRIHAFRPRNLYWVANKNSQPLLRRVVWQLVDTWNPHTYRHLRHIIRRERPDVVHVHKLRGLSPSVWSAASAENCPLLVQTCHDYELVSPEGTLESTVGRWALERRWMVRPYQALRSRLSRQVHLATAPSRYTLDTITGLGFFRDSQQVVVPNAHDRCAGQLQADSTAEPPAPPEPWGGLNLLYLGRLEPNKGIDILCRAFAQLAGELPGIRLDIAGSGAREAPLRAEFAGWPQVRFHGHVTGQDKDALIARADVLVMPSVGKEVFGISIVEAFAHGKPVIASRIGGVPELVREGETGLLVEPGNVSALQEAIRHMATTSGLAQAMSPACREAARTYTPEAVTAAYLDAYRRARQ